MVNGKRGVGDLAHGISVRRSAGLGRLPLGIIQKVNIEVSVAEVSLPWCSISGFVYILVGCPLRRFVTMIEYVQH